ncbi:MAG: cytochrome c3 family protein [Myxococcales bacterium]|nr:cytochrome c3 family protein [Myxococcales bacterium]
MASLSPRRSTAALPAALLGAALALAAGRAAAQPDASASLEQCLSCHGEQDAVREEPGERKASVYVDPHGLTESEHRDMACGDCHARSFAVDPHPAARRADCLDCHVVNETRAGGVAFQDIAEDFADSVHADKSPEFRCVHCHDAHTLQLPTTRARIFEHNKVCLHCHADEAQFQKLVDKAPPDLDEAHDWLPNRDLHWQTVRCLDCHTGYDAPLASHLILPKDKAIKNCEACHAETPTQLLRRYRDPGDGEVGKLGFLNARLIDDAYVIGATRNELLDALMIIIIGGAGGGVAGHGMLRFLFYKAFRRRVVHAGGHPS